MAEDFPENLWDRLLPQTELTLNLLQQSNATPNVSAYTHLSGPFNFKKNATSANGMCSTDTQKIRQAWNMAISFRGRVVPLHVTKSLSNACMPQQNHKKRTAHQHSRLSTQTNYQSNHCTCRQSHACNTTGHTRNQETGRHRKFARSTRPPTTCQRCKRLPTKHRSSQHSTSSKGEPQPTLNRK